MLTPVPSPVGFADGNLDALSRRQQSLLDAFHVAKALPP